MYKLTMNNTRSDIGRIPNRRIAGHKGWAVIPLQKTFSADAVLLAAAVIHKRLAKKFLRSFL
jgi:hypothetical protein